MLESDVVAPVVKWAKANDIVPIKFTPRGDVGWPDHIFILPYYGLHVWIEFKVPGETPSGLQWHRIKTINKQGGRAYWSDDASHAIRLLTTLLEAQNEEANYQDVDDPS